MKKFLVVLTILVLVAGSAFAAISGSVTAQYDFDFTEKEVSYNAFGTNGKFAFELKADTTEVTGANKPYATVTVAISYDGEVKKQDSDSLLIWDDGAYYYLLAGGTAEWSLTVSNFKIVGENWEVDFTKAIGAGGYAVSAWEKDDNKGNKTESHSLHTYWAFKESEGVTFTYDGFSVGIAASSFAGAAIDGGYYVTYLTLKDVNDIKIANETTAIPEGTYLVGLPLGADAALKAEWEAVEVAKGIVVDNLPVWEGYYIVKYDAIKLDATSRFDLRAESKDLALAEGLTAKFAGAVGYSKVADNEATIDFGFAAKADYASEKVTANVGLDLQYVGKEFNVGVAATVKVAPVTVDAFFAKEVLYSGSRHYTKENYLSLRAVAVIDPVTVTVVAEDLVNDDRLLGVKEEGTFGKLSENAQFGIYPSFGSDNLVYFANAGLGYEVVENLKATVNAGIAKDFVDNVLAFKVGAEYEHEKFSADAGVYLATGIGEKTTFYGKELKVSFEACVSTDKIVENAVLSANLVFNEKAALNVYDATHQIDDVTKGYNSWKDTSDWALRNALTLSCKVAF